MITQQQHIVNAVLSRVQSAQLSQWLAEYDTVVAEYSIEPESSFAINIYSALIKIFRQGDFKIPKSTGLKKKERAGLRSSKSKSKSKSRQKNNLLQAQAGTVIPNDMALFSFGKENTTRTLNIFERGGLKDTENNKQYSLISKRLQFPGELTQSTHTKSQESQSNMNRHSKMIQKNKSLNDIKESGCEAAIETVRVRSSPEKEQLRILEDYLLRSRCSAFFYFLKNAFYQKKIAVVQNSIRQKHSRIFMDSLQENLKNDQSKKVQNYYCNRQLAARNTKIKKNCFAVLKEALQVQEVVQTQAKAVQLRQSLIGYRLHRFINSLVYFSEGQESRMIQQKRMAHSIAHLQKKLFVMRLWMVLERKRNAEKFRQERSCRIKQQREQLKLVLISNRAVTFLHLLKLDYIAKRQKEQTLADKYIRNRARLCLMNFKSNIAYFRQGVCESAFRIPLMYMLLSALRITNQRQGYGEQSWIKDMDGIFLEPSRSTTAKLFCGLLLRKTFQSLRIRLEQQKRAISVIQNGSKMKLFRSLRNYHKKCRAAKSLNYRTTILVNDRSRTLQQVFLKIFHRSCNSKYLDRKIRDLSSKLMKNRVKIFYQILMDRQVTHKYLENRLHLYLESKQIHTTRKTWLAFKQQITKQILLNKIVKAQAFHNSRRLIKAVFQSIRARAFQSKILKLNSSNLKKLLRVDHGNIFFKKLRQNIIRGLKRKQTDKMIQSFRKNTVLGITWRYLKTWNVKKRIKYKLLQHLDQQYCTRMQLKAFIGLQRYVQLGQAEKQKASIIRSKADRLRKKQYFKWLVDEAILSLTLKNLAQSVRRFQLRTIFSILQDL